MEIKKITLTNIAISDKSKDGKPFISSFTGKPQKRVAIKTEQTGDIWLSDFISDPQDPRLAWQKGAQYEIISWQKGDFWNFKLPTRMDRLETRVDALEQFIMDAPKEPKAKDEPPKEEFPF